MDGRSARNLTRRRKQVRLLRRSCRDDHHRSDTTRRHMTPCSPRRNLPQEPPANVTFGLMLEACSRRSRSTVKFQLNALRGRDAAVLSVAHDSNALALLTVEPTLVGRTAMTRTALIGPVTLCSRPGSPGRRRRNSPGPEPRRRVPPSRTTRKARTPGELDAALKRAGPGAGQPGTRSPEGRLRVAWRHQHRHGPLYDFCHRTPRLLRKRPRRPKWQTARARTRARAAAGRVRRRCESRSPQRGIRPKPRCTRSSTTTGPHSPVRPCRVERPQPQAAGGALLGL